MRYLLFVSWIFVGFVFIRALQNGLHMGKNMQFFARSRKQTPSNAFGRHYYLIIPVLREQAVIRETIRYFAGLKGGNKNFTIVIATTKRESLEHQKNAQRLESLAADVFNKTPLPVLYDKYAGVFDRTTLKEIHQIALPDKTDVYNRIRQIHQTYQLTGDLVEKLAADLNVKMRPGLIKVIEYPQKTGVVAHQLNYAIRTLAPEKEDYIGIYNADSRPPLDTLIQAEYQLANKRRAKIHHLCYNRGQWIGKTFVIFVLSRILTMVNPHWQTVCWR